MSEIYVTENDPARLAANALAVKRALATQQRRESLQSLVTAFLAFGVIIALLALIAMIPQRTEIPQIITYQSPGQKEKPSVKMKELTNTSKPKPPGASSSMAKVIAAEAASPVSVPIPDSPVPDGFFGMEEAFGPGFGSDEGDGDGGGGASFFGNYRKGKRVVYCVDYSGSMSADSTGAGESRLSAMRKELIRSIQSLPTNMSVSVIFFSTTGWTIETKGPDFYGNGWSGVGKVPSVLWYPTSERFKTELIKQIEGMPAKGGTNWYPPLKMAFSMTPAPNIVYLLSDGDPRDGGSVLSDMKEINPDGIPIDTIAFELPGSAAAKLRDVAGNTGGKFALIYKGKRLTGSSAERYTSSDYDEE